MDGIYATRFVDNAKVGMAKPVILKASDGNNYVVKLFTRNYLSNKVLINDFICSKLAIKLGLPVPPVDLIFIPQVLIDTDETLKKEIL